MTAEHVLPNWLANIGLTSQPVTGGAASRCRLVANVPPCRETLTCGYTERRRSGGGRVGGWSPRPVISPDPVPARYEPAGCGGCGVSGVGSVARRTLREGSEDLPVTLLLQVKSAPSPRPALRVTARYRRPQGFKSRS